MGLWIVSRLRLLTQTLRYNTIEVEIVGKKCKDRDCNGVG